MSLGHKAPAFFASLLTSSQRALPAECPLLNLGRCNSSSVSWPVLVLEHIPVRAAEDAPFLLNPRTQELRAKRDNLLASLLWPFPPWRP